MDFGCGTGLVTLQLAPALGGMVGVDSSSGMLAQLEQKILQLGVTNVRAARAEQVRAAPTSGQFHLITSAMTLHHVEQLPPLLTIFHTLLQPGGYVALADLESEDGSFHDDPTGVFHHGFTPRQLEELLVGAGFSSVTVTRITEITKGERRFPVQLATAVKV
jgi:predicted TPR repeat methyltransferase